MTEEQVRKRLRKAVEEIGSQRKWAEANGVTAAYVNDVLHGRRQPGQAICKGLGLVRHVHYRYETCDNPDAP